MRFLIDYGPAVCRAVNFISGYHSHIIPKAFLQAKTRRTNTIIKLIYPL